jgi:hypothetical protein
VCKNSPITRFNLDSTPSTRRSPRITKRNGKVICFKCKVEEQKLHYTPSDLDTYFRSEGVIDKVYPLRKDKIAMCLPTMFILKMVLRKNMKIVKPIVTTF